MDEVYVVLEVTHVVSDGVISHLERYRTDEPVVTTIDQIEQRLTELEAMFESSNWWK